MAYAALIRNWTPARRARSETGERNAFGPLESLVRLYVYEATARTVNGGIDQEARSPAVGPSRSNGNPSFRAVRYCKPAIGVSSSRPFSTSRAPRSYPAAPEKSKRFSSTVTRAAGGPLKGAYCWWEVRQSAVTVANQFASNRRVPSMPMRPRTSESVYPDSLLLSPPSSSVTFQAGAFRANGRSKGASGRSRSGGKSGGPGNVNVAGRVSPLGGVATATSALGETIACAGSSMVTACGSSGAPLRVGPLSVLSQASR